jgi:hypothetical protein
MNIENFNVNPIILSLFFLLWVFPQKGLAQVSDIFDGISFSNSIEMVQSKMEKSCKTVRLESPRSAIFPLANNKEEHLICLECTIYDYFVFDEVAFTFSDTKLNQIEAKGEGVKKVLDNEYYPGYRFFIGKDPMVVKEADNRVWFLSKEGMHTNLFAWSNPYLPSNEGNSKVYQNSAVIPEMFNFGASLEELQPLLKQGSSFIDSSTYGEAETQVNCFGIEYAGFPRKIEAQFNTDGLYLLWILTAKQEEDRLRTALKEAYGEPIFTNNIWEVFNDWEVSLRKDKPEIMVLSKARAIEHKAKLLKK